MTDKSSPFTLHPSPFSLHPSPFPFNEKYLSQIPAIQLLVQLGYTYLTPEETLKERQGKLSNVLLENILRDKLKEINSIQYKGNEYLFSEENIQSAIQKLKNIKYDGLLKTSEEVYDMLILGTSLEQTIEGDSKSFTLNYIDWRNPEKNSFYVTAEYAVERTRSTETARPDIVLFVNGIPLGVIECKAPSIDVEQAVSQCIRNQNEDYIAKLFIYSQLIAGVNKNSAMYATTGSAAKFWSIWKEPMMMAEGEKELKKLQRILKSPVNKTTVKRIQETLKYDTDLLNEERAVTEQDKSIYALFRPERIIELAWKYIIYDSGIKKIARYQQYFVVKSTLERIKKTDKNGIRKGGIIWHTQGSGKSLTMVMLTRNLALDNEIFNPRIVLVTDRDDLDKQLGNTFAACGLAPKRATSGRNLLELVSEKKAAIITTLIHKFDKAMAVKKLQDESPDIFVLADESHRSNYGIFAAKMRQMFPNACYLGFTGTPLLKNERNSFTKFGGLIDPHYSISKAVEDGAVVPLLYEGRYVELEQNKEAIDLWFERHTQGLTKEQKADLKRKYAKAEMLNKTDQVVYMRAFDISEHFRENYQGTDFKGQLVAPGKKTALKYHNYLNEIGVVSSEVVISPPDNREGYEETDDESSDEVVKFWQKMMRRYGKEEEYTKQIINQFKNGIDPEILIVVDKLITGFDAPRNSVMYLCRVLKEHTLLQAIARVNRLYEGKDFGLIVDYANILGELDQALIMYNALEGYNENDIDGTLCSINNEVDKLSQKYSDLWDIFKTVKNSKDEEAYELILADDSIREDFYERLYEFSKTLSLALSSYNFLEKTDDKTLARYKADLKKFQSLKASVKLRFSESIDYRDYEPKIKKLLDTHIQANEVIRLNEPVNILDDKMFGMVKEEQKVYGSKKTTASRADTIAHATKKSITEKMEEDPAFYQKFSKLIQQVIDDYRAKRISDLEYLKKASEIRDKVAGRIHDDVPDIISDNEDAMAYYGIIKPYFDNINLGNSENEKVTADTAIAICKILDSHKKVHFWDDEDAQKKVINAIDDYLFDEIKDKKGIELNLEQMDELIERTMQVARSRNSK